jgi:hypothetical protein
MFITAIASLLILSILTNGNRRAKYDRRKGDRRKARQVQKWERTCDR